MGKNQLLAEKYKDIYIPTNQKKCLKCYRINFKSATLKIKIIIIIKMYSHKDINTNINGVV